MRNRLLALALTVAVAGFAGVTSASAQTAAPTRRPDVIYVPTPEAVVEAMLQVANVTKNDVVYDLGCGDGRIPVTAARSTAPAASASTSIPQRIKEANENVAKNNVGNLVKVVHADLFETGSQRRLGGHAVSAAVAQREADAEADERAQARHAHRLARLRHGRLEAGEGARRRRPQGLLLDDSEAVGAWVLRRLRLEALKRPRLILLILAVVLAPRQSYLAVSGGFRTTVGGFRISVAIAACHSIAALIAGAWWFYLARRERSVAADLEASWSAIERNASRLIGVVALIAAIVAAAFATRSAAGADASGISARPAWSWALLHRFTSTVWSDGAWVFANPLADILEPGDPWLTTPLGWRPAGPSYQRPDLSARAAAADGAPHAIAGINGATCRR